MIRQWLRDRRWRKQQAPREGWLHLFDRDGELVAKRPVTMVPTTEGVWANPHELPINGLPPVMITSACLIDPDGNRFDVPFD